MPIWGCGNSSKKFMYLGYKKPVQNYMLACCDWGPEGWRPKAVHVEAKPPIHAGAGFSADRRWVWSSGPKAGVWSCGSSVLGSQGVVIISNFINILSSR